MTAAAQDGTNLKWHPDGAADLILDDGNSIMVPPGSLGSLFGPGKRPFDGVEINVTVRAGGPEGGISGPLHALRPVWEELSGGKLNIIELPFAEHYTKMMLDLRNQKAEYDAFIVGAFWYGDIVAGDFAYPINEFMKSGEFPQWTLDTMPPSLKALHLWGDDVLGTLNDADGQVLYYRRDVLNDREWQAKFKADRGYELPVPPKTWQQLLDVAQFFNGKNWDARDEEPESGMVLHLKVGEQSHYHFQSLSASFVINPGDTVTRTDNIYWFDPTDMTPLINGPGHVAALEFLQELHKTGPAVQIDWSLNDTWDYFLGGKSIFAFSWANLASLAQDERRSKIKGKLGSSILPSSGQYWDLEEKRWVDVPGGRHVGNTTGGSRHGVISAFSKNPEAVYSLLALMALKPVSLWNARNGWTGVDPGYGFQFMKPQGEATVEDYTAAGWDAGDVEGFLTAYYDNFYAPTMQSYLRVPGTFEYWDILDKNLSSAISGQVSAQEALDATANAWDPITDRLDRSKQLKLYQESIGYKR